MTPMTKRVCPTQPSSALSSVSCARACTCRVYANVHVPCMCARVYLVALGLQRRPVLLCHVAMHTQCSTRRPRTRAHAHMRVHMHTRARLAVAARRRAAEFVERRAPEQRVAAQALLQQQETLRKEVELVLRGGGVSVCVL